MTTDYDKLRELAEAATPGPWRFVTNGFDRYIVGGPAWMRETMRDDDVEWGTPVFGGEPHEGAVDEDDPNVRYVCAASPSTILSLLDRLDRAERERDEAREERDAMADKATHAGLSEAGAWAQLRREKAELRAALELRPEIDPALAECIASWMDAAIFDGIDEVTNPPPWTYHARDALRAHAAKAKVTT